MGLFFGLGIVGAALVYRSQICSCFQANTRALGKVKFKISTICIIRDEPHGVSPFLNIDSFVNRYPG